MAFEIQFLQEFMQAVENEFWAKHPELYARYCVFLGTRIQRLQRGDLSEKKYTEEWRDKHPEKENDDAGEGEAPRPTA